MTNEELVLQIQKEGKRPDLMEALYQQNKGLVCKLARKFSAFESFEDLCQEGFLALIAAADQWREDGGASFATFAFQVISQQLRRYINEVGNTVRIPEHILTKVVEYEKTVAAVVANCHREPKRKELMAILGVSRKELEQIIQAHNAMNPKSFSDEIGEGLTVADIVADPVDGIESLLDDEEQKALAKVLWQMVDDLGPDTAAVMHHHYQNGLTFQECGEALGISCNDARRLEANAIRKLRQPQNRWKLRPYVAEKVSVLAYRTSLGSFERTWTSAPEAAVLLMEKEQQRR